MPVLRKVDFSQPIAGTWLQPVEQVPVPEGRPPGRYFRFICHLCGKKNHIAALKNVGILKNRSCGCEQLNHRREFARNYAVFKHGQKRKNWESPLYRFWRNMKKTYYYEPWKDFKIFEVWIIAHGMLPNPGEMLMRINSGDPWGPDNIKKTTRDGMANSRKSVFIIELEDGIQVPLAQACKMFGAKYHTVYVRMDRGYSVEEALGLKNLKLKAKKIRCDALMVRLDGELVTLAEAGRRLGIAYKTLFARVYVYEWPIEKALETDTMRPNLYEGLSRPELAEKYGIKYFTLVRRLERGWPLGKALTTPMADRGQNKK